MAKAILIDVSKCMGCRGCQVSCKQWWELAGVSTNNRGTYENPPELSAETWTTVLFKEFRQNGTVKWLFRKRQCMHCTEAPCVEVCPVYARAYHPIGYVAIDQERCIGCGRCVAYCPFGVPKLGAHDVTARIVVSFATPRPVAYNCAFCKDRVAEGMSTACAKTCPTGAIQFGERDELVEMGRARVDELKATYPKASLYGEEELGGLHVMYVLPEEPNLYALPEKPQVGIYPEFPKTALPAWYLEAIRIGRFPEVPPGWPVLASTVQEQTVWPLGDLPVGVAVVGLALKWLTDRKSGAKQERETSRAAKS